MENFVKVARTDEVNPGEMKMVEVEDEQIVVANLGGTFVAFTNECPHSACDLVDGQLDGDELECDCHGSSFNVRTRALLSGPATEPPAFYAVRVEGDDLLVGPA